MTTSVSQFEFHEQHAGQPDSRLWAFDAYLGGAGVRAARRARPWQRRSIERRPQPAEVGQVEAARLDIAPKAKCSREMSSSDVCTCTSTSGEMPPRPTRRAPFV